MLIVPAGGSEIRGYHQLHKVQGHHVLQVSCLKGEKEGRNGKEKKIGATECVPETETMSLESGQGTLREEGKGKLWTRRGLPSGLEPL